MLTPAALVHACVCSSCILLPPVSGMGNDDSSCQGPLCALLPQLPVLNTSLPEIQIPMTLLANLTALLKPHPLPDVEPLGGADWGTIIA
jgi:hypothetical protein